MRVLAAALGFSFLLLLACSSPTGPDLENGVLATFRVHTERYSIFITNPQTIEDVIALWNGQSTANIPSGRVRKGRVAYNKPWSWHIDSEDIAMAEATIELCDGVPSYIEAHLDDWIATVGYFCPWSAELVALKDYR
ncbi:MAG: hypothetical protein HGA24_02725 [Candidatus Aminicenantes bacterium]|nr:hypothetical protein [Candidatus Aminicenantes bacterium]